MIISASRRTDLPCFYAEWLVNRLQAGFVWVRNPMNGHQVSEVSLSPEVVDGLVLWTKNPLPLLSHLEALPDCPYYFQFTLTPYAKVLEPGLPEKQSVLIPAFQALAKRLGRERVIWRYDPIFFSPRYTAEVHVQCFARMAAQLAGYTEECTVSFLDYYRNTARRMRLHRVVQETAAERFDLMARFAEIAQRYGLALTTCAETQDFSALGIGHAHCIDKERLERLGGVSLKLVKDKHQRPACGCVESIDIGAYHSCVNGCAYCYATSSRARAQKNRQLHDPTSPLLFGSLGPEDVVKPRRMTSCRQAQLSLFE